MAMLLWPQTVYGHTGTSVLHSMGDWWISCNYNNM